MNVTVNLLKSARSLRSAKSLRFFRVARSQRALRLLKFLKKFRFVNLVITSLATFQRIKDILKKTWMCLTSFKRIVAVMFLVFYVYAAIGLEVLYYSDEEYQERLNSNPEFATFASGTIGNFTSFIEAFFALFQILTESGWHYTLYVVEEFKGYFLSSLLLISFHLIINYVLRAILLGMIWEVFIIVTSNNKEFDQMLLNTEPDSDEDADDPFNPVLPVLGPHELNKRKSFMSVKNLKFRDLKFNGLFKELFSCQCTSQEIKHMKRFMRRKFEVDDLNKKKVVPKKHWKSAMKSTISSSIEHDKVLKQLSTIIGEPRFLGTPLYSQVSSRPRRFINRPISPRRPEQRLKINKIIYNTEIYVCSEVAQKQDSLLSGEPEDHFTESDYDDRFEMYNESQVDELSVATSVENGEFKQPKDRQKVILPTIIQKKAPINGSRSFIRQKTLALSVNARNDDVYSSDEDEEEELVLNGDYILRQALLKDHDIGELSTKEMQHCLIM